MTKTWTFGEVLSPVKVEDFLTGILGKSWLHLSGHSERFSSLLSWADINRMLCRSGLDLTRVHLSNQNGDVPTERFSTSALSGFPCIRTAELNQFLADGAVLAIDSAADMHEPILDLCRAVERSLGVPIQAQIRCSCREMSSGAQSSEVHSYDHDIIVFELLGAGIWSLQSEGGPGSASGAKDSPGPPDIELKLRPGDLLYIPRGQQHSDRFLNEPSASITVIFRNPTGVEITARLFDRLKEADFLKPEVPRFATDDVQSAYLTVLQAEIIRICTEPGLLLGFMRDLWSISEPTRSTSLPWGALGDLVPLPEHLELTAAIRFPHNDTLTYSVRENAFEVVHEGHRVRLDADAAKIVECILASGVLSVAKLADSCPISREQLFKYLSGMIGLGLLIVREPVASTAENPSAACAPLSQSSKAI